MPEQILKETGIIEPETFAAGQYTGIIIALAGAIVAVWCVLAFVFSGSGTPAPFDPPRRLVIRGPYRYVRNPMYIGAILVLGGAAFFYQSPALFFYTLLFWAIAHLFVIYYEEPVLMRKFGPEYLAYQQKVKRWRPKFFSEK
jgi:protein-S-isoprenylcysteine O-methyltransferase Ste14